MANKCNCPTPPSGSVTCEGRQVAVCRIVNGQVEGGCYTPPSFHLDDKLKTMIWLCKVILPPPNAEAAIANLGQVRLEGQAKFDELVSTWSHTFLAGTFEGHTTFSLPPTLVGKLRKWRRNSDATGRVIKRNHKKTLKK
jgi:hypothetical protein